MKIYCKYNLFWIKWANSEVHKLILSSDIAFSRKTGCRNLSLRPHDGFSWDVQIVPNLCSYGPKSWNFKVFMCKYLFHAKNPNNLKKWKKLLQKYPFLPWKRYSEEGYGTVFLKNAIS